MANKASAERVQADIRPPNYRAAVQLIRHDMKKKKDRISGINGEIADAWAKVEGHKVDKIGAKLFMKLDALEPDERLAAIRAFNGLADVADWPLEEQDLVDSAENKVVHMRLGDNAPADAVGDDELSEEDAAAAEDGPAAGSGASAAMGASRKHLGGAQPEDEAPEGEAEADLDDENLHT
jgi:hypothetical protein